MSTPEGRVKNEVKKQLKALGAYQFWPVQSGLGAKTLDCLVMARGWGFAIETKAPGKRPTPLQLSTINAIERSGNKTFVIDSVDVARLLPEILKNAGINLAPQ